MSREVRIITDLRELDPADWAQLDHDDNPFLSLAFLRALAESGTANASTGWQAHHLALFEAGHLVAIAPSYLKAHSHGEFVFDWAWADAYQRHGLVYYPKLLTAIPYSPIPGPRLLARRDHSQAARLRQELIALAIEQCEQLGLSSWHCNFIRESDLEAFQQAQGQHPLLARDDWQFHWHNQAYSSFEEFLATLKSKKRKNMLRDRRLVHDAGIRFRRLSGSDISERELDFIFSCYQMTFMRHGNHPALTREFFEQLLSTAAQAVMVVIALRADERIAMSFFLQGGNRLYGRYWGCLEEIPGLHFETAYHQGIEHCIENGLQVFEPGAQGEHKISRGFMPVKTWSYHHIQHPGFRDAIARYLQRESDWAIEYGEKLMEHLPFRQDDLP